MFFSGGLTKRRWCHRMSYYLNPMKTNTKIIIIAIALSVLFIILQLMILTTAHAGILGCSEYTTKRCISNISYWYDSCGNIQAVNQNCNLTNQACFNGSCINKVDTNSTDYSLSTTSLPTSYIQNYRTNCYSNNIYWYDSKGSIQGIYQNCQTNNSCAIGSCQDSACKIQLRCDGSTCAVNSADYITYCQNNERGQTVTATSSMGQATSDMNQNKNLAVSLFVKKQSTDWAKSVDVKNNDAIAFLIIIKNISGAPVKATILADITSSLAYTGNLNIDGVVSTGSIVAGIDLGALPANASKAISFNATAQSQTVQSIQVVARTTSNGSTSSDVATVTIDSGVAVGATTAAVSSSGSPFFEFIKKWYLWIIIIVVLVALFFIIFRRLSRNP